MKDNEEVIDVVAGFDEATLRRIMNQTFLELTPIDNIISITEGLIEVVDSLDINEEMKNFL